MYGELCLIQYRHNLKTRTVVGWKTGVAARLRAEAEVGSVIGRASMVETAYRVNGCDQRMQTDCAQRTMIRVFPMFLRKCHKRIDNSKNIVGRLRRSWGCCRSGDAAARFLKARCDQPRGVTAPFSIEDSRERTQHSAT